MPNEIEQLANETLEGYKYIMLGNYGQSYIVVNLAEQQVEDLTLEEVKRYVDTGAKADNLFYNFIGFNGQIEETTTLKTYPLLQTIKEKGYPVFDTVPFYSNEKHTSSDVDQFIYVIKAYTEKGEENTIPRMYLILYLTPDTYEYKLVGLNDMIIYGERLDTLIYNAYIGNPTPFESSPRGYLPYCKGITMGQLDEIKEVAGMRKFLDATVAKYITSEFYEKPNIVVCSSGGSSVWVWCVTGGYWRKVDFKSLREMVEQGSVYNIVCPVSTPLSEMTFDTGIRISDSALDSQQHLLDTHYTVSALSVIDIKSIYIVGELDDSLIALIFLNGVMEVKQVQPSDLEVLDKLLNIKVLNKERLLEHA